MIQKKVRFGTVCLQKLRRVAIPQHLADNMGIVEGDELAVFYDPDSRAAVLVKADTEPLHDSKQRKGRS